MTLFLEKWGSYFVRDPKSILQTVFEGEVFSVFLQGFETYYMNYVQVRYFAKLQINAFITDVPLKKEQIAHSGRFLFLKTSEFC